MARRELCDRWGMHSGQRIREGDEMRDTELRSPSREPSQEHVRAGSHAP